MALSEKDICLTVRDELPEDPDVRNRILEKYARLKGLQFLQTQRGMTRDSKRLHNKAMAVYDKLGLKMPKDDTDDEIVLGDKTTTIHHETGGAQKWLVPLLSFLLGSMLVLAAWSIIGNDAEPQTDTDTIGIIEADE